MKNINKKIGVVLGIILFIIFIFIGILSIIINGDKISKNTYINDINIGELTKNQANEKLQNIYSIEDIKFRYNDRVFILYPKFNENRNKPKVEGEDNQYRINLIPNDENKDLYIYLKKQIKQMNNYFNYID